MVPSARRAACRAAATRSPYLTLRQWSRGESAGVPGVDVRAVGPRMELYREGRRRTLPPARLRPRRLLAPPSPWAPVRRRPHRLDAVLLAAGRACGAPAREVPALRRLDRGLDQALLAGVRGARGRGTGMAHPAVRRADAAQGVRVRSAACGAAPRARPPRRSDRPRRALCGRCLASARVRAGRRVRGPPHPREAGAFARSCARRRLERIPELRAELYGDGPDREEVLSLLQQQGLNGSVSAPGFVDSALVEEAIGRALCFVLPSRREGYGLVVVEAAAAGTPTVVVAHPDNAAVELVDDGENGVVVESDDPEALAAAIVRIHEGGQQFRTPLASGTPATRSASRSRPRSTRSRPPTRTSSCASR